MPLISNFLSACAIVIDWVLKIYMWVLIARVVLSWVSPDPYNPIVRFIHNLTEPILYQIRRRLPMVYGGLDLSPLIVFLAIPKFLEILPMFREPKPLEKPDDYPDVWPNWFVAGGFVHNRRFGSLFLLGLILDAILVKWIL